MRTLIVCHDAGGAEVISSWVLRQNREEFRYLLAGPAAAIFGRKLGPGLPGPLRDASEAGTPIGLVLCGSSGPSDFERKAVAMARTIGTRSVVWLDHWENFAERVPVLPDEVWVSDKEACRLAWRDLPGAKVRLKGNPYLEDFVAEIERLDASGEPRDGPERLLLLGEASRPPALAETLVPAGTDVDVRVRPHPSAAIPRRTLAEDVAWATTVVGWKSMALACATLARRRAVSLLPASEPLPLPFPEIERLYSP